MARDKEQLGGLLSGSKPEPDDKLPGNADLDFGYIRPSGVGLRQGELLALDEIAQHYEISRNSLLRLAARRLIMDYREGRLDLSDMIEVPKTPRKKLRYK